jgi:signal transduction histidine kinase
MSRSNGIHHPVSPEYDLAPGIVQGSLVSPGVGSFSTRVHREQQVAVIAHEMRNSLAVMRGATKLLQGVSGTEALEGSRALIERHTAHLARHIDDLLAENQGEPRGDALQAVRADLRRHVRHAADAIMPECRRRAHRLLVAMPVEPVWAYADGERIEQALSNLLVNAAKYSPDGGKIVITLEDHKGWAVIRVTDSGIGISSSLLPRVFDLYVRGEESILDGRHGIGLYVVRDLVARHGGSVKASSPGPGQGSEFTVTLPTL